MQKRIESFLDRNLEIILSPVPFIGLALGARIGGAYWLISRGSDRVVIRSFESTGLLFKTPEITGTLANTPNELLHYSLKGFKRSHEPIKIPNLDGKEVCVHYEHYLTGFPWRGETSKYVTRIERLD